MCSGRQRREYELPEFCSSLNTHEQAPVLRYVIPLNVCTRIIKLLLQLETVNTGDLAERDDVFNL